MTNNDILRRIRYAFDFSDTKMIALFWSGGAEVTREQVSEWLKKDADPAHQMCGDGHLATFLNGLIIDKRGKRRGPPRAPVTTLTKNDVLKKLKIALDLQADDMLAVLAVGEVQISKHELSALFRKQTHKNYRECRDSLMHGFLKGLQLKYRDGT